MDTPQAMVESYARTVQREIDQRNSLAGETRKRLVWFVAIAGYVLLNVSTFGQALVGRALTKQEIFILVLPWILSSVFALAAHFMSDECDVKAHKYYTNKLAMIDIHLADLADEIFDVEKFKAIMYDQEPEIKALKQDSDKSAKKVNRFESLSMLLIVIGFAWSVIFPLLLHN